MTRILFQPQVINSIPKAPKHHGRRQSHGKPEMIRSVSVPSPKRDFGHCEYTDYNTTSMSSTFAFQSFPRRQTLPTCFEDTTCPTSVDDTFAAGQCSMENASKPRRRASGEFVLEDLMAQALDQFGQSGEDYDDDQRNGKDIPPRDNRPSALNGGVRSLHDPDHLQLIETCAFSKDDPKLRCCLVDTHSLPSSVQPMSHTRRFGRVNPLHVV